MKTAKRKYLLSGMGLLILMGIGCLHPVRAPLPPESNIRPSGVFQMPLKNPSILSGYGPRGRRFHTGIDLREKRGGGDPVLSSRAGRVTYARRLSGYGNIVAILHEDGFTTRYAHLKKILVKEGEKVKAQERIGIVGSTGRSTTPHLHFEILTPKQRFLDPKPYLFPGRNPKRKS